MNIKHIFTGCKIAGEPLNYEIAPMNKSIHSIATIYFKDPSITPE